MKTFVITRHAESQLTNIAEFIVQGNLDAGLRYIDDAKSAFYNLQETPLHRRASEKLPDYIREMPVPGFKGYTLRVAYIDDKIGLVAAFRPGFTDAMKNRRTHSGVRELKRS